MNPKIELACDRAKAGAGSTLHAIQLLAAEVDALRADVLQLQSKVAELGMSDIPFECNTRTPIAG